MDRPWFSRAVWGQEPILDLDWRRWIFGVRWTSNFVVFFGPLAYLHRRGDKRGS